MLVLKRNVGQRIRIGDDLIIQVTEVRAGAVKMGFECPKGVPVFREEIYLKRKAAESGNCVEDTNA